MVLTALVCWLFLGSLSSTMNVLFAIPMSLLGTIAVLYFVGFTLNTFTLLGLSLAVGLVVDDAVMVMENIFRHAEMGKDRVTRRQRGTKEITFAALAATIAVIAIFLPVAFMSGVIGKFFLQFGVTLSVAVAISYFEAITLAPARCAQMLQTTSHDGARLRRPRRSTAASTRSRAATARALGGRSAVPWIVLARRRRSSSRPPASPRRGCSRSSCRRRIRAASACGSRRRSARRSTRPTRYVRRAEKFLEGRPEVVTRADAASSSAAASCR